MGKGVEFVGKVNEVVGTKQLKKERFLKKYTRLFSLFPLFSTAQLELFFRKLVRARAFFPPIAHERLFVDLKSFDNLFSLTTKPWCGSSFL